MMKNQNKEQRMISRSALAITLLSPWMFCVAAPISGDFDGLLLAVDPARNLITGYFESYTGKGKFSCIYFLQGQLNDAKTSKIKTWFPKDRDPKHVINGVIKEAEISGKPAILVKLDEEHGGCWNVQHFADNPTPLRLTSTGQWKEIRVVASHRAYFYDEPNEARKRKAYAVMGNALRLYEFQTGWVRGEYISQQGKRTTGWMKEGDLFAANAPNR